MATMSASEFKARCLAVLADVARTGEPVIVLKRGQPVARVLPVVEEAGDYPQQALADTLDIVGDVITPVLTPDAWDAERQ